MPVAPNPGKSGYNPLPGFQSGTGTNSSAGLPFPPGFPSTPPIAPTTGTAPIDLSQVVPSNFPGATFAEMLVAFGVLVVITLMLPRKYAVYYPFFVLAAYGASHTTAVKNVLTNVFGFTNA